MFHIIDSERDLKILDKELMLSNHLAVDTEFNRKGKEEIELCLIQVNNSEETFLIDCILLGEYKNNCKFLFSKDVKKIFHSFREDVEAIYSWTQSKLENVFDSQVANSFLGGSFSIGYQNLVLKKFGVSIDKDETRSNWKRRPLSNSQLKYAASDVEFLIEIFNEQKRELIKSRKMSWFEDEINFSLKKIFSNEETSPMLKTGLSKSEESNLLSNFSNLVNSISEKKELNATMLFSKKNQREFLRSCFFNGFSFALKRIPNWKKDILLDDLYLLFKDCPE